MTLAHSMRLFGVILILTLKQSVNAQEFTWGRLSDCYGYYFLQANSQQSFPDFSYFELGINDSTGELVDGIGRAIFWNRQPIDSLTAQMLCPFDSLHIDTTSLYFRSDVCSDESYSFEGKWLLPPSPLGRSNNPPVLEGLLIHHKHGKLSTMQRVSFYFSPGC